MTTIHATTDERGKATVVLRPGLQYYVDATVDLPDLTQACAEPVPVDAGAVRGPLQLLLTHHFGNCMQFAHRRERKP
jgi:hypothetical protein